MVVSATKTANRSLAMMMMMMMLTWSMVMLMVTAAESSTTSSTSHGTTNTTSHSSNTTNTTESHTNSAHGHGAAESHEPEPALAVIFPWFSEIIGVFVFYVLSRYLRRLPYTAVLFVLGVIMGIGAHKFGLKDQLTESILMWTGIDSEVLLLVFLPGLIFRDAYSLNVHLFVESISQILIFAFPMVLAGTTLTALVAFYIFPYGWGFNLCMTFGSILAATDPVAVASLLDEVGAPPRLKIHIAGESLLNDGSAVVFYSIFSGLFLLDLGIDGLGTNVDLATGIELFCRMALGGACIGVFFGTGLVQLLGFFKRRLSQEENVVEVTASIAIAYVCYYVAEVSWGTSGLLATVFCGVTTKAFGASLVNDPELLDNFWVLVEHLLNSLLFVLGGAVWGGIIAEPDSRDGHFAAQDWGYLFLLYLCVTAIRYFLFYTAFPITKRLGLKTNWQETFFTCYGGLRGAVGIALALSLDNRVIQATEPGSIYREFTTKIFAMVGGIALLTLVINGLTAGPLLQKLGLTQETETRRKIVENFEKHLRTSIIENMVHLLTQRRFHHVDFAIIRYHIKQVADLTKEELDGFVERHKQTIPPESYQPPHLKYIYPYLEKFKKDEEEGGDEEGGDEEGNEQEDPLHIKRSQMIQFETQHDPFNDTSEKPISDEACKEFRLIFISLLRAAYHQQVRDGELAENEGFLSFLLFQSLDFAADEVKNGGPINDWVHTHVIKSSIKRRTRSFVSNVRHSMLRIEKKEKKHEREFIALQLKLHRALAVLSAHMWAQEKFRGEFEAQFPGVEQMIIRESNKQIALAHDVLLKKDHDDVDNMISHIFCSIVLNNAADKIVKLGKVGLLKATEAEEFLEEIEHELSKVQNCTLHLHPGEVKRKHADTHRFF